MSQTSDKAVIRSLYRMCRLIDHQSKSHLPLNVLSDASSEFQQRKQMLAVNGITVPSDKDGILGLIADFEHKGKYS